MHLSLIVSLMSVVAALTESTDSYSMKKNKEWKIEVFIWTTSFLKKTVTKQRKVKKLLEYCKVSIFNTKSH